MGMYVVKHGSRYVGSLGVAYTIDSVVVQCLTVSAHLEDALIFGSREHFDAWLDSGAVNCTKKTFYCIYDEARLVPYAEEAADMVNRLVARLS